jgi:hypothetical protein
VQTEATAGLAALGLRRAKAVTIVRGSANWSLGDVESVTVSVARSRAENRERVNRRIRHTPGNLMARRLV